VEEVDWSTGQILDKLEELGVDDETLVLFTSDNGGATHHGASNAPLRGGKGTTWEGGHRVCALARWPGRIPAGGATDEMALTMDVLPTFAALAGAELPEDRLIDGQDIRGLLMGDAPTPHPAYYYFHMRNLDAVRSGRWKLFTGRSRRERRVLKQDSVTELYDLHADIGETTNVADAHPLVVERLRALIGSMREDLSENARRPGFVDDATYLTEE